MHLEPHDVERMCVLIQQLCGLELDQSKGYLLESRLRSIVQQEHLSSYRELVDRAQRPVEIALRQRIVDAITTHETMFFRDNSPFDALRYKALPETIDTRSASSSPKRLRFWSAACSTGQETYSIAMILHEMIPKLETWDIQILGTDISEASIKRAASGWYDDTEIQRGLSPELREKYFSRAEQGWQIHESLRRLIQFRRLNLLQPLPDFGTMDIVFCRNVALYFSHEQQKALFRKIRRAIADDGYLFIGAAEFLLDLNREFNAFAHCRGTYYRPLPTVAVPHPSRPAT
ncbi:CheR family methyltransferase [Aureliella helgolandensis]|uniref:protein-glutamate O-methyltransferase n=1 Tax=Aureliella helgolandensis TaxID=2527968 RepID=A0A518G5Y1_9BACT|nr:protein-glutamate O-methyltransferase CheR [Aureliella helgolandensis]QDV24000.1 Chemotaxis protein methyltransferase Cher2 [Aureliella helgolandensis]